MIVLFTDFGPGGPYVGQMKAVLLRTAPGVPLVDLMADAPAHDPMAAAYLLAALAGEFAPGSVFLAVVDPGVGSARRAVTAEIDGRWYVAPDNGLLEPLLRRAKLVRAWEIAWRPERLSASFHGRDLFAPIAARLACGERPATPWAHPLALELLRRPAWPDELARVVYIDHFGNAVTGLRASALAAGSVLEAAGRRIPRARTFGEVPQGSAFWYENSSGLAEIAVNQGRAEEALGLSLGSPVSVRES
ncbi:MAG TPA: SAM-dependent chlorinase/fluorinase [Alphaproteobacteria bacterium]|nr:SAM-dependent chlorinase/fluorinase [Alphaproteobacteria bacterium]